MRIEASRMKNNHEINMILSELRLIDEGLGHFVTTDNMSTNKDIPHYLYVYDNHELVGCANLFLPNKDEVEVQIIANPDNNYQEVFETIYQTLMSYDLSKMIYMVNDKDVHGNKEMISRGFIKIHDEVVMKKSIDRSDFRMKVQSLRDDNIGEFDRVFREVFDLNRGIEFSKWEEYVKHDDIDFYLFSHKEEVVGICGSNHQENSLMIFGFGVLPSYRKQGLGRLILEHMESIAAEKKLDAIHLEVDRKNHKALDFYFRYGLRVSHGYAFYLGK